MRTPARGDIWLASLDPTLGQEQQGLRPVLVVSDKSFNRFGLCVVCPITQGGLQSRFAGFAVPLMGTGCQTQGVVMCNQPRTIDMQARQARFIERVPPSLLNEVMARLQAMFED